MPSIALGVWNTTRSTALDAVERAHTAIRKTSAGRREATRQLNHAYVMLLAAEFQGFCRDLHTEAVRVFATPIPEEQRSIVVNSLTVGRQLARGNATPSSLGADFGRFGFEWKKAIEDGTPSGSSLCAELDGFNKWRNAIAHNDFESDKFDDTIPLRLKLIRRWRKVCHLLASRTDEVVGKHLAQVIGSPPW